MDKTLVVILFLFFTFSCQDYQKKQDVNDLEVNKPIEDVNSLTPEISNNHCKYFPTSEVCLSQPVEPPDITEKPEPNASCEKVDHSVGAINKGGFCVDGKEVPITFIFVNSSGQRLSLDPELDSLKALDQLNNLFQHDNHQYIKFKIQNSYEIIDNIYYNTSCDELANVSRKYGDTSSLVMVFVNNLSGSCAGVSWIWNFPSSSFSVTMAEYRYPFIKNDFTPIVHEFAHTMGLNHTSNAFGDSAPGVGTKSFNHWLDISHPFSSRRCFDDFQYFIDPKHRSQDSISEGLTWNSLDNTMYPSFGDKVDAGFFTSGYDYSISWAFDCWYELAKIDL